MHDRYREMEQRGRRVTQFEDRVRVQHPDGSYWDHLSCGVSEYHGRKVWHVTISAEELPPAAPWWRKMWRLLRALQ
jgi:hypothetical protein